MFDGNTFVDLLIVAIVAKRFIKSQRLYRVILFWGLQSFVFLLTCAGVIFSVVDSNK